MKIDLLCWKELKRAQRYKGNSKKLRKKLISVYQTFVVVDSTLAVNFTSAIYSLFDVYCRSEEALTGGKFFLLKH